MIKNLTPHAVRIMFSDGTERVYASDGLARVGYESVVVDQIDGVEVVRITYGTVEGLPEPDGETYYIVSQLTAAAARQNGRSVDDLLLTADLVRDDQGRIVGCRQFARID